MFLELIFYSGYKFYMHIFFVVVRVYARVVRALFEKYTVLIFQQFRPTGNISIERNIGTKVKLSPREQYLRFRVTEEVVNACIRACYPHNTLGVRPFSGPLVNMRYFVH